MDTVRAAGHTFAFRLSTSDLPWVAGLELLRRCFLRAGPYLAVEVLLPGGTLIALILYLYRRRFGQAMSKSGGAVRL